MTVQQDTFRRFASLLSACALAAALSACTERPETEGVTSDTAGVVAEAERDTSALADDDVTTQNDTVGVELVAFQIDMPSALPPGPTVFRVENVGEIAHNFEIEGQGIERIFDTNLQEGETRMMRVNLQSGTYTIYCPVGDHRAEGMQMQLTVSGGTDGESDAAAS